MHRYALLHWRFFDRFVNEQTNWLAPDNFQEDPKPVVAMRTSPTNLGLQMLATISARDLGFITLDEMARRLELAFRTLERMRRLHGHFYNWYDLADLRVLEPAYVSTVDSGNLAGHFVALRQACLALADEAPEGRIGRGLDVALMLAEERRRKVIPSHPASKRLAAARKLLTQAGRETPKVAALSQLADLLRRYETEIGSAELENDVAEGVTEWTTWSLRLIAEHQEWMERLGARSWELGAKSLELGAGSSEPGGGSHRERAESERGDPVASHSGIAAAASPPRNDSVVHSGTDSEDGVTEGPPRYDSVLTLRELATQSPAAADVLRKLEAIGERAYRYAMEMDFRYLLDKERKLFTIGFAARHRRRNFGITSPLSPS